MSMTDPYFVVKEEVSKALNQTKILFHHWQVLNSDRDGSSLEEIQRTTTDLKNCIKSIEWDLEDLEDTIGIVEKNPSRFRINQSEVVERQSFVKEAKIEIALIRESVVSAIGNKKLEQPASIKSISQAACRPIRDTLRNISAGYVPIPTKVDACEEHPLEKKKRNQLKSGKKEPPAETFVLEPKSSSAQPDNSPVRNFTDFEILESDEQALMQAGNLRDSSAADTCGRVSRNQGVLSIRFRGHNSGQFHRIIAAAFAIVTVTAVTILMYIYFFNKVNPH